MLLTYHKIERLNYQLVRVLIALKCKLKKGQEPIKTLKTSSLHTFSSDAIFNLFYIRSKSFKPEYKDITFSFNTLSRLHEISFFDSLNSKS